KDGGWRWILTRGDIVKDAQGKPCRWVGTNLDITAQKQLEAEKEKLEAQNRQLQKSESLGRMAASIAHHFNNQLGAVIGNMEMAMDELPKGASTHQTLTKAMQSAWTAADMSGLMLTYLGQTHEKREPLDISYSCRKILPLIETSLPGNVVMETDFPLPRPIIMANAGEIQQILTNLITNAREAIGTDKGTISLSVKTVSPAEITTKNRFPVDWESLDKTFACMDVTDTGCGIEDKDIEKLFDPFYSTKFTGRGMSLPVVLGLVNSYKGVITMDSKPGKGSTFRIFFPMSEEAPLQPQTAENDRDITIGLPSPRKMEEGGTVLVVEDEEPLRKMAAIMLERLGFTVLEAKDGIEALDVFGKHQSEIRLVLTDLTMPRMNGWETLTALRKLQPDIPVILASGYDLAHVMEGDHPELPQACLAKPYNLKALRAAISQTLEIRKKQTD
ncbi:MAG: ATP-binding protein, partial [Deltaproteobacteria bacterium]